MTNKIRTCKHVRTLFIDLIKYPEVKVAIYTAGHSILRSLNDISKHFKSKKKSYFQSYYITKRKFVRKCFRLLQTDNK